MKNSMKSMIASPLGLQASSFEAVPQRSLRMALCLNGTVPVAELARAAHGNEWLQSYLRKTYPDAVPGETGPITIVLVL